MIIGKKWQSLMSSKLRDLLTRTPEVTYGQHPRCVRSMKEAASMRRPPKGCGWIVRRSEE